MSLKNNLATCEAVYQAKMAKKWAYFVNWSTTTKMQSLPYTMGNPVMKSIEMLSHFSSRMGNDCNNPVRCFNSPLFLWQTTHSLTCRSMSSLRPFQENLSLMAL